MLFDVQLYGMGNLEWYLLYYRPSHSILLFVSSSYLFWYASALSIYQVIDVFYAQKQVKCGVFNGINLIFERPFSCHTSKLYWWQFCKCPTVTKQMLGCYQLRLIHFLYPHWTCKTSQHETPCHFGSLRVLPVSESKQVTSLICLYFCYELLQLSPTEMLKYKSALQISWRCSPLHWKQLSLLWSKGASEELKTSTCF